MKCRVRLITKSRLVRCRDCKQLDQNQLDQNQLDSALLQSTSLAVVLVALTPSSASFNSDNSDNLDSAHANCADLEDRVMSSSVGFGNLLGYRPTELQGQTAASLNLWDTAQRQQLLQLVQPYTFLQQLPHKSGELIDLELTVEPMPGKPNHLLVVVKPPAQCQQVETQLQESLAEKAVLLKEIHHRVRNNLHLIANLLDLQAGTLHEPRLSDLFATTQDRIQAMTLIHEQLYQSDELGRVEFGEYLKRLTLNVFLANSSNLAAVMPVINVESVWLNLETAVPCGLLIHELLVNSLKHAFPEGEAGEVHILLNQTSDQRVYIQVWDTGRGLSCDWQNAASLGFKLVRILAKQLKAEMTFESASKSPSSRSGTAVTLAFTELKYKPRF
jgi:two-component sensor histidine kinase